MMTEVITIVIFNKKLTNKQMHPLAKIIQSDNTLLDIHTPMTPTDWQKWVNFVNEK